MKPTQKPIQTIHKRAESPPINNVGQRPTKRGVSPNSKPQRGVIKMSPFQGLITAQGNSCRMAMPYATDFGLSAHPYCLIYNLSKFSAKNRYPFIDNKIEQELWTYIGVASNGGQCERVSRKIILKKLKWE